MSEGRNSVPKPPAKNLPSHSTPVTQLTNTEAEAILTGKTLEVYKYLLLKHKPVGPREVQRSLKLSSPGVATFHLDKLQRSGLINKNQSDGSFTINRIYLKHYFLLRSYLIPRYFLYAGLFTVLSIGWMVALFLGIGGTTIFSPSSPPGVFYVFLYGLVSTILAAGVFWFESLRVLKRESI